MCNINILYYYYYSTFIKVTGQEQVLNLARSGEPKKSKNSKVECVFYMIRVICQSKIGR